MVQDMKLITKALKDVPEDSILYLSVDVANYYVAMLATMDHLKNNLKMSGVYVSASRSADRIRSHLKMEKIDIQHLYFVDTISILSGARTSSKGVQIVESPAMLETILLKIRWFFRHIKTEERFVFFDSLNALSVYNEPKLMCEFLHILINLMRAQEVMTVLLAVEDQTPLEVQKVMELSADDTLTIKERGVALNGELKSLLEDGPGM